MARRWLLAAIIVFGAYNPSGVSYYHWLSQAAEITPQQVFTGILLLTAATALGRMAFLALGYFGLLFAVLAMAMGPVLGAGLQLFDFADFTITIYTVQFWLTTIIGTGLFWPFFQRHISGERDVLRAPP